MRAIYDSIVIGAGIVGVSTALHLQRRGQRVLLLDRRGPGEETSYGNAGFIETSAMLPYNFPAWPQLWQILRGRDTGARLHWPSLRRQLPWFYALYRQSRPAAQYRNGALLRPLLAGALAEHQALLRDTAAAHYLVPHGYVRLYRSAAALAKSAAERALAQKLGVPFDLFTQADFQTIEPDLKPVYAYALRWSGTACLRDPGKVTAAYAASFVRHGGDLHHNTVTALTMMQPGQWHVVTAQGNQTAANVVICAGPWAQAMLAPLGYNIPLALKRGYHQHYTAQGNARLTHSVVDTAYGYVIAPMAQGYRVTTGAEFAAHDAPPDAAQLAQVLPHARALFPLASAVEATPWHGSRPCFSDALPMIGPAPRHAGLWFNFGHGHLGLTLGPATGRLLADMLCGGKTYCDPQPYRATRFRV